MRQPDSWVCLSGGFAGLEPGCRGGWKGRLALLPSPGDSDVQMFEQRDNVDSTEKTEEEC
jgi:hypothetical protein